jgi:hypothetical protein
MLALLIVTVIGVGGPPGHPRPLRNATVFYKRGQLPPGYSYLPPPPLKTDKRGRVEIRLSPGAYRIKAGLGPLGQRPCSSRTVTMTGKTQRVRLTCQIR